LIVYGVLCITGEFIVGRVIKALNNSWHPDCFRCQICAGPLADSGFVKNAGRYRNHCPYYSFVFILDVITSSKKLGLSGLESFMFESWKVN